MSTGRVTINHVRDRQSGERRCRRELVRQGETLVSPLLLAVPPPDGSARQVDHDVKRTHCGFPAFEPRPAKRRREGVTKLPRMPRLLTRGSCMDGRNSKLCSMGVAQTESYRDCTGRGESYSVCTYVHAVQGDGFRASRHLVLQSRRIQMLSLDGCFCMRNAGWAI